MNAKMFPKCDTDNLPAGTARDFFIGAYHGGAGAVRYLAHMSGIVANSTNAHYVRVPLTKWGYAGGMTGACTVSAGVGATIVAIGLKLCR